MLTPAQLTAREGKLTASSVACLMTGDADKIVNLWRELVGDPDYIPEDLSGVWPVQLGTVTEALNLDWFARKRGPVIRRGDVVTLGGPTGWAAATLDGWSVNDACPIECKHVGGREPLETIIARYQPQMHWQMIVTEASRCALSVIMGANEPIIEFIDRDSAYADELWRRAVAFMECVWSLTPPVTLAPIEAPVKAEKVVDMSQSNSWVANAATWLTTIQPKKDCEAAEKELKAMVPRDVARAFGGGIECRRDRAGRLSIRAT